MPPLDHGAWLHPSSALAPGSSRRSKWRSRHEAPQSRDSSPPKSSPGRRRGVDAITTSPPVVSSARGSNEISAENTHLRDVTRRQAEEIARLQHEVAGKEADASVLHQTVEHLKVTAREKDEVVERLHAASIRLEDELVHREHQDRLKQHTSPTSPHSLRVVDALKAQVATLEQHLRERDEEVAALKASRAAALTATEADPRQVGVEVHLQTQLREQALLAQKKCDTIESKRLVMERDYQRLLAKLDESEEARRVAELRYAQRQSEIDELQREKAARDLEVTNVRRELEDYISRDRDWEERLRAALSRDREYEMERAELEQALQTKVHSQAMTIKRLEEELTHSTSEMMGRRQEMRDTESRLRAMEEQTNMVTVEAQHTAEQLRRAARMHEQEAEALRGRLKQRDDEIRALQLSNREWLRQFRKQKQLLAEKTLEVNWLRSLETSDAVLQQLDISSEQAASISATFATPSNTRTRRTIQELGYPSAPPLFRTASPVDSPSRSPYRLRGC